MNDMATNLFDDFPTNTQQRNEETSESLLKKPEICFERIISTGQASLPEFWYSQPQSEWVTVIQGSAGFRLENKTEVCLMHPVDFVNVSALCKHRVEWISADERTI